MKIETIEQRIENNKKNLAKVIGTLQRHNSRLEKLKASLAKKGITNPEACDKYDYKNDTETFYELYDLEDKLEDIKKNELKLEEISTTLNKNEALLQAELKKLNMVDSLIPEVLINYLEDWKQEVKTYYLKKCEEFIELRYKEYEITREELESLTKKVSKKEPGTRRVIETVIERVYSDEEIEDILNNEYSYKRNNAHSKIKSKYLEIFEKGMYNSEMYIIQKAVNMRNIKVDVIEDILSEDVRQKKESFVNRIQDITGKINSMCDFIIASNGEINGIAKGEKGDAKVTTIIAGGYNIQCRHFRVLVNPMK